MKHKPQQRVTLKICSTYSIAPSPVSQPQSSSFPTPAIPPSRHTLTQAYTCKGVEGHSIHNRNIKQNQTDNLICVSSYPFNTISIQWSCKSSCSVTPTPPLLPRPPTPPRVIMCQDESPGSTTFLALSPTYKASSDTLSDNGKWGQWEPYIFFLFYFGLWSYPRYALLIMTALMYGLLPDRDSCWAMYSHMKWLCTHVVAKDEAAKINGVSRPWSLCTHYIPLSFNWVVSISHTWSFTHIL